MKPVGIVIKSKISSIFHRAGIHQFSVCKENRYL
jgi:hypothetical protein